MSKIEIKNLELIFLSKKAVSPLKWVSSFKTDFFGQVEQYNFLETSCTN